MTTRITQNSGGMLIAAGVCIGLCFNQCLASETCKNNSGNTKHVCVAWDREAAPYEGTDFEVDYACQGCSDDPAVVLMTGDDKWIVYSEVISTQVAANIGALTTPDEENYVVKIANGANAGAANVASMVMTPPGDHSSSIATGSRISGNLSGDLTLQESSGGSGGALSLTIGGDADGDITAATISSLTIGGDLTGALQADELSGSINISGSIDVLFIYDSGNGTINGGTVEGLVQLCGDSEGDYSGTATFSAVDQYAFIFTMDCSLSGTLRVTGSVGGPVYINGDVTDTGLIDIDGELSHQLIIGGDAVGDIDVAGNLTSSGKIKAWYDISGDLTISGDVDGEILADSEGDGDGEITGEFNGNICGDNLSPLDYPFAKISIGTLGDDGLICGARPGCGDGTISSADPADGTQDSRQPHPPGDCSLSARQGIGSEDEPIEITLSEGGANNLDCWQLCETDVEDVDTGQGCSTLSANAMESLTETSTGVYEIVLERPISAGEWTTISYLGDDSYVAYSSLPSDAEADGHAGPDDILKLIDYLNEVSEPPYGDYSCDMDHSNVCGSPDILRLNDLRNGTSKFIAWSSKTLPSNTCP